VNRASRDYGLNQTLGRAEATQRILAAARSLFVGQDPESVPIRRIAEAANVNHALVHRYVGSKDELLAIVLEREAEFFASVVDQGDGATAAALALFDATLERGDFVTMLTRATLSGQSATRRNFESGALQRLVTKLSNSEAARADGEGGSEAPRYAVAAYAALLLGWSVFHEFLVAAVFINDDEVDQVEGFVRRAAESIIDAPRPTI
jgi:AcrR family transcriptional regulator